MINAINSKPNASDEAHTRIRMQIMWNRLISVVEEQAQALIRSSFSPAVREGGDIAAGVFDRQGRLLAQAVTGTPGHVNTMAAAVPHFLDEIPIETMKPHDAFITNDPWLTSGHLHDVTVVTPAFFEGRIVGFFAALVHVVDVGGRGMGPDGRSVFEEGICIPIMQLVREGELNEELMRILRINSREPLQVEGDILAIAGAGEEGARRLQEMMAEFQINALDDLAEYIIDSSRDATLACIQKLEKGIYHNEMTVDGYEAPVRIVAALEVGERHIHVDYEGTSAQSTYGINVVFNYTLAYTVYGIKCLIAPGVPNNHGSLEPFTISVPKGCILNVERPAPVSARHILGHAVPDVVLGCLHRATTTGAPAESSMMWNPYMRGGGEPDHPQDGWEAFYFNSGGMGARPMKDGLSATAFPSGVRGIPVEAAEATSPLVIWRKEFRPNSGGAGRFRGGLGQIVEISADNGRSMKIQAMFDRVLNPARGRDEGSDGLAGTIQLDSGQALRSKGLQDIPAGSRLVLELPGGGGFGRPEDRSLEAINRDLQDGLLDPETAQRDYSVTVVDGIATRSEL